MNYSVPFISKKKKVWGPIHGWLLDTLGPQGHLWKAQRDRYYFRYEKDLTLFLLRWL